MRSLKICVLALLLNLPLQGQVTPPAGQTARQALLEMLFGKAPDTFVKHLPDVTRQALIHQTDSPAASWALPLSMLTQQISGRGGHVQTFDAGPTLLSVENPKQQDKFEIVVERDDLHGEENQIELSFRSSHNGETQALPVLPRLILSMKQEKAIWKLNEVTLAVRVPLSDPDFLKGLQKMQNDSNESSAVASVRTLFTAETAYATSYPEQGYTCKLHELGGVGKGQPTPHSAMLIDFGLTQGQRKGYQFAIAGCDGVPSNRFRVTAAPLDSDSGMRAFCTDESGVLRFAADGSPRTCLSSGQVLK
jgi:type IV pilus assembly protein PilA